jgi:hypothetical protein
LISTLISTAKLHTAAMTPTSLDHDEPKEMPMHLIKSPHLAAMLPPICALLCSTLAIGLTLFPFA